ncbi:MAG: biotin/lipoyl-binding protein, partial [Actinobacteria bacterium]|nr:biotin/lipoyl-binding protein [Actinomycetota bacterium]
LSHPDFAAAKHSTRWVESSLDFTELDVQEPPVVADAGLLDDDSDSSQLHETDVTAELQGRRYQLRMWLPTTAIPATVQSPSRSSNSKSVNRSRQRRNDPASRSMIQTSGSITAPMQGTIIKVLVEVGQEVDAGQTICVLEAMKMENMIESPASGTVRSINVSSGDYVAAGDELAAID